MTVAPHAVSAALDLSRVDTWIFDIDNTLYPARCDLFSQIHQRMARYVAQRLDIEFEAAKAVRSGYFHRYGTTMRGLMAEHGVDPNHYMAFVHDIDYSAIRPDPALRDTLASLPGRKLVFTNASVEHGERCAQSLGVADLFDGWFDIRNAEFAPKPDLATYQRFARRFAVPASGAIFFEDTLKNLDPAKALGWQTAYIAPDAPGAASFVDAHASDLNDFFAAHWARA